MDPLTPTEARALGVLIEKAQTTPDQYPLTLNAALNGANQKSNRDPITTLTEDAVWEALEGLRGKGLVVRVDLAGSRVPKYKHTLTEKLNLNPRETAILAELLLRGPQTLGELRGHASRMYALETTEIVRSVLTGLANRPEPLVRELPPFPGTRAERFGQLLAPDLHPVDDAADDTTDADADDVPSGAAPTAAPSPAGLGERVTHLESDVARLTQALRILAEKLGEPDPLAPLPAQEDAPSAGDGASA